MVRLTLITSGNRAEKLIYKIVLAVLVCNVWTQINQREKLSRIVQLLLSSTLIKNSKEILETSITDHYTLTVPRVAIRTQEDRKNTRYRNWNLLKNRESKEKLNFLTLIELQKSKKLFETNDIHSCFEQFNLKLQEIVNKFIPEKIKTPGQNKNCVDNQINNFSNKKYPLYKKYKIESMENWERYCAVKRKDG